MDCDFVIPCLFIPLLNYNMSYLFYFNVLYKLKVVSNSTMKSFSRKKDGHLLSVYLTRKDYYKTTCKLKNFCY